jgi:type IX secretion system PorP/SprF family membrane protein
MRTRSIRLIAALLMTLTASLTVNAQTDAQFSQYYEVPTFYNPAAIGSSDYIRVRGGARLQWVGIDNAPRTFLATADMPFKFLNKRFGVGVVVDQESAGLYKSLNLGAQIGYKFKKFGGEFTVAAQIGMYDQSFKGSEVYLPDEDDYHQSTDDGIPMQDIHGTALDLGLGLWYVHKKFWTGVSLTHANSPTVTMNVETASGGSETSSEQKYQFQANRTLYFMAGSNIPLNNTLFEVVPSLLVKSDMTFWSGEINARVRYNKMFSGGIGYRWDDAIIISLAAEIKDFYIGYSYDYATSAIRNASSGSHEIFAGYRFKLDFSDKNKNKQKSIRIM